MLQSFLWLVTLSNVTAQLVAKGKMTNTLQSEYLKCFDLAVIIVILHSAMKYTNQSNTYYQNI